MTPECTPIPKTVKPAKQPRRLPPMSKKRRKQLPARAATREQVMSRDRTCAGQQIWSELACGFLPGRTELEVDELRGGARRCTEWLDPESCQLLCPIHHDAKTANKREWLARREALKETP